MRMTRILAVVTAGLAITAASTGSLRAEDAVSEPDMWAGGSPDFCEACGGEIIDDGVQTLEGYDDVLVDPADGSEMSIDPVEGGDDGTLVDEGDGGSDVTDPEAPVDEGPIDEAPIDEECYDCQTLDLPVEAEVTTTAADLPRQGGVAAPVAVPQRRDAARSGAEAADHCGTTTNWLHCLTQ